MLVLFLFLNYRSPMTKTCKKCLLNLSIDKFYKEPTNADGYRSVCASCWKASRENYTRPENPPSKNPKLCAICSTTKPASEFYKDSRNADGLKHSCVDCLKQRSRSYSRANTQLKSARHKLAMQDPAARAKRNQHTRIIQSKPENRSRHLARLKLNYAIRSGKITRLPCEVCGNPKSQAHHDDYSKPLDVKWKCQKHHSEIHRKFA